MNAAVLNTLSIHAIKAPASPLNFDLQLAATPEILCMKPIKNQQIATAKFAYYSCNIVHSTVTFECPDRLQFGLRLFLIIKNNK